MKAIIFCPNWIGDVVMATPTLRALRRLYPAAQITGLMRPYVAQTLAGNPWLDDVMLYDPKAGQAGSSMFSVIFSLRERGYDIGVLLTNSLRTALIAWLAGVKRRVGYAREGRRILLNDPLAIRRGRRGYVPSPLIDYYFALARHLGATDEPLTMELFTSAEDEARADALWKKFGFAGERVVVLNPGAAFGPAKRWPSEYFARLAQRITDEFDAKCLVICGPSERGFARFIADAAARPRQVKSLAAEEVSIGLTKAIIRRAELLVSTDSGPRHFGAAFGIPVISLFGPTHIEWTDTHYPRETMLQKKLPCGPCQQRTCPLGHHQCMKDLSVDEVFLAATAFLSRASDRKVG